VKTITLTLIALALAVSGYLLFRHFALSDLSARVGPDFCSAVFGAGCDKALRSPWAVQMGLPLAGWGLVCHGTLAALLLLGWSMGDAFRFEATVAALVIALAAALGSVVLFVAMVSGLAPFCPLCAVIHAINLTLVFPLKRLTGGPMGDISRAVVAAGRYLVGGATPDPTAAKWKIVGFLVAGLVAVVIYQWVYVEVAVQARSTGGPFDPAEAVALFESSPQKEIPLAAADPRLGPADAPVRMVVFSDFQCPGCTRLSRTIPALAKLFDGKLQIIFKHFPLDSTCNPLVKKALHPGACHAALAAEAARDQGKFWAFHDALFMPRSEGKVTLKSMAKHLGLDADRFEAHGGSEGARAKVRADIDLGISLGVDGTPSVFINGRRVHDTRPRTLRFLIAHQLEHH